MYWPQDRAVKHGPFMIKLDGEVELADYVIRKMTVTQVCIHRQANWLRFFHPLFLFSFSSFMVSHIN